MKRTLFVLLIACLAGSIPGVAQKRAKPCGKGNQPSCQPEPPPVEVDGWRIDHSTGVTLVSTPDGPAFTFPPEPSVNKLTKAWPGTGAGTVVATVRIDILSGEPVFQVAYPLCPPKAATGRLYIERDGWASDDPDSQYFRWWSRVGYINLGPGTITMSALFDPAQWSSVQGRLGTYDTVAESWFWQTVREGGRIGFTFGGGCHYGHGVYVTDGTATFTVMDFLVQ